VVVSFIQYFSYIHDENKSVNNKLSIEERSTIAQIIVSSVDLGVKIINIKLLQMLTRYTF
jgi:hypothetical protein